MATSDELRFGILGPLTAQIGSRNLDIGSPKQKAVLALMLINVNQALSLERMVWELWPTAPPRTATATLQAYVSNLRRVLEPDRPARSKTSVLISRRGSYELAVDPEQLDSRVFERLAETGGLMIESDPAAARRCLSEALDMWRGPALVEFAFDEFAQSEVSRLEERRVSAIENRFGADLALGRAGDLVAELERTVTEHPLRERMWGHLMLALYRAGRQAEALRAYRRCEEALGEELGIMPSTELRDLEMAILNQEPALAGVKQVPVPAIPDPGETRAPSVGEEANGERGLVGRMDELTTFRDLLASARTGHGSMLFVEGDAGIGKTRLLETFLVEASATGVQAGLARCVEVGGTPPFWPWIQLARAVGVEAMRSAAGALSVRLEPLLDHDVADPTADRPMGRSLYRVAEGLVAALRALTVEQPMVLLIDDLYSADPDSLSLLALVAAEIEHLPVVLVTSHRGSDLPAHHPLAEVIIQTSRLRWVHRMQLQGFTVTEVAELILRITGHEVAGGFIETVHERTDGNGFFIVELVKLLDSEGGLTAEGAMTAVPLTVRELIGRRLAAFPDDAVRLLRVGACMGRTFELAVVADAAGFEIEEALNLAEVALASGLITDHGDAGTYRFSHVLVVDAVTGGVGALRRAQLHDRIAAAIEAHFGDDPTRWLDIAHHRVEAMPISGRQPAIDALARAGRNTALVNALELAEELLARRLALTQTGPPSCERNLAEVEALVDLVLIWTWRDGYHSPRIREATARLLALTDAAEPQGLADTLDPGGLPYGVLCGLQAHSSSVIVAGRVDGALGAADNLLKLAKLDSRPYVVAIANMNAAVACIYAGRVADALGHLAVCEELIPLVDPGETGTVMMPLGEQAFLVTHRAFSAWARWLAGEREAAQTQLKRARAVCDRIDHAFSTGCLVSIEAIVASMDRSPGWVADALRWGAAGKEPGVFGLLDAWHDVHRLWVEGMTDPSSVAADRFRAAIEQLELMGARAGLTLHWGNLAELEIAAGMPERALLSARSAIERSEEHGERFWYPELERLTAVAFGMLGEEAERDAALRRAETGARELGLRAALDRLPALTWKS